MDAVYAAEPFHLIGGFQAFGDAFGGCHLGNRGFELFPCRAVNVKEMLRQFAGEDERGECAVVLLLQLALAHSSVLADIAFGLCVHDQIGDLNTTHGCISDVHFVAFFPVAGCKTFRGKETAVPNKNGRCCFANMSKSFAATILGRLF